MRIGTTLDLSRAARAVSPGECAPTAAFRTGRRFATRERRVAHVTFTAPEYQADGSIRPARYVFDGSEPAGWEVLREGQSHLRLGPGYRLLAASHCGVCA